MPITPAAIKASASSTLTTAMMPSSTFVVVRSIVIVAVVSVLEALALIAAGVMGMRLYRQTTEQIKQVTDQVKVLEQRHVEPLSAQAASILQTVQRIAARVEHSTTRVDSVVDSTVHSAEAAVDRVQGGMRKTAGTVVGVVRGVRTAIETFLTDQPTNGRTAAGKADGSGEDR